MEYLLLTSFPAYILTKYTSNVSKFVFLSCISLTIIDFFNFQRLLPFRVDWVWGCLKDVVQWFEWFAYHPYHLVQCTISIIFIFTCKALKDLINVCNNSALRITPGPNIFRSRHCPRTNILLLRSRCPNGPSMTTQTFDVHAFCADFVLEG